MFGIKLIKNAKDAAHYFGREDLYYLSEDRAKTDSVWWGKGAEKLGLQNKIVDEDTLRNLMEGRLPNGEIVGLQKDGSVKHRVGYDLCFSAPKSVSILAFEDQRYWQAHREAVAATLRVIERECAQARRFENREIQFEKTQNLVVARIEHGTSRKLDPQVHTHALVMNLTERSDGKWRALASNKMHSGSLSQGVGERIHEHQLYYSAIYSSELAKRIRELGHDIEIVGKNGLWEIKRFPREVIDHQSKRRQQIKEEMKNLPYSTPKAIDLMAYNSRPKKLTVPFEELKALWKNEMAALSFSPQEFIKKTRERQQLHELSSTYAASQNDKTESDQNKQDIRFDFDALLKGEKLPSTNELGKRTKGTQEKTSLATVLGTLSHPIKQIKDKIVGNPSDRANISPEQCAKEAVLAAIQKRSHFKVELDYEAILTQAFQYAPGHNTHHILTQAVDALIAEKQLIPLNREQTRFTTQSLIDLEKNLISQVMRSDNQVSPLLIRKKVLEKSVEKNDSRSEQKGWVTDILKSTNRLSLIEQSSEPNDGFISALLNVAEHSGLSVHVISPNRTLAHETRERVLRQPQTLWQWLVSQGRPEIGETLAGFCFRYEKKLQEPLTRFLNQHVNGHSRTENKKSKELLIVDSAERLGTQDVSRLLELAEQGNARVVLMHRREALARYASGDAISILKKAGIPTYHSMPQPSIPETQAALSIQEIKEEAEAFKTLATHYATLSKVERDKTQVIADTKTRAQALNGAIRTALKTHGQLSRLEHQTTVLMPVFLNDQERTLTGAYTQGMVIRFLNTSVKPRRYGAQTFQDFKVKEAHQSRVLLTDHQGRFKLWDPRTEKKDFRVFKEEPRAFAVGDALKLLAPMTHFELKAGARVEVTDLSDKTITLFDGKKHRRRSLEAFKNNHFDYAYASTLAQTSLNQPKSRVLAYLKSYQLDKATADTLMRLGPNETLLMTDHRERAEKQLGVPVIRQTATSLLFESAHMPIRMLNDTGNQVLLQALETDIAQAIAILTTELKNLPQNAMQKAVDFAIRKISAREAGFKHETLVREAIVYGLREGATEEEIQKMLKEKEAEGVLVKGQTFHPGTYWTTREALEIERRVLAEVKAGKGVFKPLLPAEQVTQALFKTSLTQGQKEASHLMMTTQDQFVMIQGYAGTGKTTLFKECQRLLPEGYQLRAVAPTHRAVFELRDRGIEAQTLKSFILDYQNNPEAFSHSFKPNQTLMILDEASMVSNQDFDRFVTIMRQTHTRTVFSGDMKQQLPIESGKLFEVLQRARAIDRVFLTDIVRQESQPLKEAVIHTIKGDFKRGLDLIAKENPNETIARQPSDDFFKFLTHSVVAIDNREVKKRMERENRRDNANEPSEQKQQEKQKKELLLEERLVQDYITRTPGIRQTTAIIVHAHRDREYINALIRDALKKEGEITPASLTVARLMDKGLTDVEKENVEAYQPQDVVKLGKTYYHVASVDGGSRSVTLTEIVSHPGEGKTRLFYPARYASTRKPEIYEPRSCELNVGDRVRLTKTDRDRKRFANVDYQVTAIEAQTISLQNDRETITLNPRDMKDAHWDYAYTMTGYTAQAMTKPYVIDYELSYRKNLTNQREFYIAISREKKHLMVYTNHKEALLKRLLENAGDKLAALEVTGEVGEVLKTPEAHGVSLATHRHKAQQQEHKQHHQTSYLHDAKEVLASLQASAESIVEKLLGEPNHRLSKATEWRYGSKGSLAIKMEGEKRGLWHNFETGEKGNLIQLIQNETGLNFQEALQFAADFLGKVTVELKHKPRSIRKDKPEKINNTRDYALKIALESKPLAGTLAERYLRDHRGILNVNLQDVRFHSKVFSPEGKGDHKYGPALVVIGRNDADQIQCVQVTYLDSQTANKVGTFTVKKRTLGSPKQASVVLQRSTASGTQKTTYVAEGVETGSSIKDALPHQEIRVTLGKSNFLHLDTNQVHDNVVFCLDNDGDKTFTDKTIHQAAQRLIDAGKEVFITWPEAMPGLKKTDFNDLARTKNIDAIRTVVEKAVSYAEFAALATEKGIKPQGAVELRQSHQNSRRNNDPLSSAEKHTAEWVRSVDQTLALKEREIY